jgi:hypothetical protein
MSAERVEAPKTLCGALLFAPLPQPLQAEPPGWPVCTHECLELTLSLRLTKMLPESRTTSRGPSQDRAALPKTGVYAGCLCN